MPVKPKQAGYQARVIEMGLALKPGTVGAFIIAHDDWCGVLKGKGVCTCDPEITFKKADDAES